MLGRIRIAQPRQGQIAALAVGLGNAQPPAFRSPLRVPRQLLGLTGSGGLLVTRAQ